MFVPYYPEIAVLKESLDKALERRKDGSIAAIRAVDQTVDDIIAKIKSNPAFPTNNIQYAELIERIAENCYDREERHKRFYNYDIARTYRVRAERLVARAKDIKSECDPISIEWRKNIAEKVKEDFEAFVLAREANKGLNFKDFIQARSIAEARASMVSARPSIASAVSVASSITMPDDAVAAAVFAPEGLVVGSGKNPDVMRVNPLHVMAAISTSTVSARAEAAIAAPFAGLVVTNPLKKSGAAAGVASNPMRPGVK